MNLIRLARMGTQKRIETIQGTLRMQKIQTLRKWGSEYGLMNTDRMSKDDLVFALTVGVHQGVKMKEDE